MKVVYNACFGGFSLSLEAEKMYLERKGHTPKCHEGNYAHDAHWYIEEPYDFFCRDIDRGDPDLVYVVETLGEKANGDCARLEIEDVPAGTLWRIDEYDGNESVMTPSDYAWKVAT